MGPESRWNPAEAEGKDRLSLLVYRSRLLGQDRSVANYGGGNTSSKGVEPDFRWRPTRVMWVKGSGSDLAAVEPRSFTGLRLDDVEPLLERPRMSDEEMVTYLAHCVTGPGFPRPSIETLMHAFLPFPEVDHTHPDAVIALCTAASGEALAREVFGDRAVWIPYQRPGFSLAREVALTVRGRPGTQAVLLAKHGLIVWGDTAEESYARTISVIREAHAFLERAGEGRPAFGGPAVSPLSEEDRRRLWRQVLPELRGLLGDHGEPAVLTVDDSPPVMEFVCARDMPSLAATGPACPDHLVHTRRVPCVVSWDPTPTGEGLLAALTRAVEGYREEYAAYLERNRTGEEVHDEPVPRVILVPGLGMVTQGRTKWLSTLSRDLYHRAIAVMRLVSRVDRFVSLTEAESYAVEYWPLERYKLTLLPPPRALERKVALVTGGAGGIGRAVAERLAEEGAHVVLADLDEGAAREAAASLAARLGEERVMAVGMDVTREESVTAGFEQVVDRYGGVDVVVASAGIATSNPVEQTTLAEWQRNMDVLATGYFLVAREAFRLLRRQGTGGALVFVASKNSLASGAGITAYGAAKAAELHLARCLAHEGGPHGIRVNVVCPDAVLVGSRIWSSSWRESRARQYGIAPEELEEFYRRRTLLGQNVLPEDVAEAVAFFATPRSAKTTGGVLTVDGGIPAAFVR